jgi:hypothetical protein
MPSWSPFVQIVRRLYEDKFTYTEHLLDDPSKETVALVLNRELGTELINLELYGAEWLARTSFERFVWEEYEGWRSFRSVVEASVYQHKKLAGDLFE